MATAKKTETKQDKQEQPNVAEPPKAAPRTKPPTAPVIINVASAAAVAQIKRASTWVPHLAITGVEQVRTLHLHPSVATYKTEMLEYLNTRLGA